MIPTDVAAVLAARGVRGESSASSHTPVVWRGRFEMPGRVVLVDRIVRHGDGTPGGEWPPPVLRDTPDDPGILGSRPPDAARGAVRLFDDMPPGRWLAEDLLQADAGPRDEALATLGSALAALHSSDPASWPSAPRGVPPLVALCRDVRGTDDLGWLSAEQASGIRARLLETSDLLSALDAVAALEGDRPLHGSASIGQVWLADAGEASLVGWWQPCRGHPAVDVGIALGDLFEIGLTHAAVGQAGAARAALGAADVLLVTYRQRARVSGGAHDRARFGAVAAARIVEHMIQNQAHSGRRDGPVDWAIALARQALSLLP